ncbi:urea ABC transporter permease subunit UrtB [Pseudogemmobacter sp. W21_MBD1_M6]|uniref:urea ABC transporter permease subunit UrtB n=1 Tax=Pseudogemmobacter sp. W21_MBD1_M6 TaxID=3240271 RepID=UPI003F9903AF
MFRIIFASVALLCLTTSLFAQARDLQAVLQDNRSAVESASRKTIDPLLDALLESALPEVPVFLERWREKDVWQRKSDGRFFFIRKGAGADLTLVDLSTGAEVGQAASSDLNQLKPNSGVRGVIGAALVQFQLSDPDPARRLDALAAIERDPQASHLAALRRAINAEPDAPLLARKSRLERLLTIRFDPDPAARVAAIESFHGDLAIDVRAALNPILATRLQGAVSLPDGANIARQIKPGSVALPDDAAYTLLVAGQLVPPLVTAADQKAVLIANIKEGQVAGVPVADLGTQDARDAAYIRLAVNGTVPPLVTKTRKQDILGQHVFFETYAEPVPAVTNAATAALRSIDTIVGLNRAADLALDGLSLASIYFLAAIGLAITFGVMGVINMAHGEFIMMGAYTGYVVQQFIPNYTVSILVALPLAFAVTFAAGVAMERLVIRHLYNRPLETLLATFGISIALQQLAKNIFGTQARPLTSPAWLDGAWVLNDIVSISYIRIAIFVLALMFLSLLLFILKRTRLGLEVRAVTQNPRMAASMGINPDKINMLTFGLGSGIAGIAGVAIGLFAKVTSELGSDYIVQSFMTVVVGGVGNIWATLAGASLIGFLQKGIEFMNPSNTLAAQTYMIVFIIVFIQFRPKGIIALKGRAAGD